MTAALPPILLFPWGRAQTPGPALPAQPSPDSNALILVADVSNYSGPLSDGQVEGLIAAGVAHVIVRISTETGGLEAITRQQLATLRTHGMSVSGYIFPDYGRGPADFLAEVFNVAGEIRSLWLDLEPPGMPSFAQFRDWASAARAASKVLVGIYTSAWVIAQLPDWEGLSDFDLWDANYGPFKDLTVNFGGWSKAAGVQYAGSVEIGGVLCDLSFFDPVAIG